MRSPWGQKQLEQAFESTLLFTAEQAELMQAPVRTRPQRNNPNDELMQSAEVDPEIYKSTSYGKELDRLRRILSEGQAGLALAPPPRNPTQP